MKLFYDIENKMGKTTINGMVLTLTTGATCHVTWDNAEVLYNDEERLTSVTCEGVTVTSEESVLTLSDLENGITSVEIALGESQEVAEDMLFGAIFADGGKQTNFTSNEVKIFLK